MGRRSVANLGLQLRWDGGGAGTRFFVSREGSYKYAPRLYIEYTMDTTPPSNPTGFTSVPAVGVWSQTTNVGVSWSGGRRGPGAAACTATPTASPR